MHNNEILVKLAERTITYFKTDLSLPIEDGYEILDVNKINYLDITTLISLSNDMIGTVGMSVSKELSIEMVKNFVYGDISDEDIEELSSENVAETLNITLGNILKELTIIKEGGSVNISTPYTMHNSVNITKKRGGSMYLCRLKLKEEGILLSYFM